MISSIISIIKMMSIPFITFTHVMVPIMIIETILEMILINWITDRIETKSFNSLKESFGK